MVHLDPATLKKHPIVGVLIGAITAAFLCFLLQSGWAEVRVLLAQKSPDRVSIHDSVNLQGIRWITVTAADWHCDQAVTIERTNVIERWLRGPVETTEVPLTGDTDGELLVASFDGALKCAERAGSSLTGVVGSTEIFTSRAALRRWGRRGNPVAVLNVGASPRFALIMLVALVAIDALAIGFAAYYLRLMLRSRRARERAPLPTMEPIHPR